MSQRLPTPTARAAFPAARPGLSRRGMLATVIAVASLHLGFTALFWRVPLAPRQESPPHVISAQWWQPPPAAPTARRAESPATRTAPPTPAARRLPAGPVAKPSMSADFPVASPSPAASAAPAAPPQADTARPLDLELKPMATDRPSLAVRDDPRVQSRAPTPGERMAATLGTDTTLRTESRGDGRWRIRQGTGCVDMRPSRAAQVDPSSQTTRPVPNLAEACPR